MISWLPRSPPVADKATQPETLIHPVTHEIPRLVFFQLMIAAQWYWPPAVGNALMNSAIEAARHRLKHPAVMRPQMTAEGPPDGKARLSDAANAVHVFKIAKARPSMEIMLKLRCNSCLCPMDARAFASSLTDVCRLPCMAEDLRRVSIVFKPLGTDLLLLGQHLWFPRCCDCLCMNNLKHASMANTDKSARTIGKAASELYHRGWLLILQRHRAHGRWAEVTLIRATREITARHAYYNFKVMLVQAYSKWIYSLPI